MTTPQPQRMKRYRYTFNDGMLLHPDGDYVHFDDPAIVAAREAMENILHDCEDGVGHLEPYKQPTDLSMIALRLALAGLQPKEQQ